MSLGLGRLGESTAENMLDTILHIGKLISEGRDPWEDIIDTIEPDTKGDKQFYQLDVLFNLDQQTVDLDIVGFDGRFPRMRADWGR